MAVSTRHIITVSPPMYGHAVPLCRLGILLTDYHQITFVIPDNLLSRLQNEFREVKHGIHGPVRFVGLQPKTGGTGDVQVTSSERDPAQSMFRLPFPVLRDFFLALGTKTPFSLPDDCLTFSLVGDVAALRSPVDAIIVDNFLGGPVSVVHPFGLPYYLFNSCKAQATLVFLGLETDEPESFRETLQTPPYFMHRSIGLKYYGKSVEDNKHLLMDNCQTVHLASGIIFNCLRDSEVKTIEEIRQVKNMSNMALFFLGPLLASDSALNLSAEPTMCWLDRQAPKNVIYIAFGSLAVLMPNVIAEIGKALLALKMPFIWALNADQHVHLPELLKILENTEEPIDDKFSFRIAGWVPQKEILAHPATKVFVSHCGWNSVMESLSCGVPIVAWPMFADQLINAEWLEQEGVGKLIHGTGIKSENAVAAAQEMGEIMTEMSTLNNSFARRAAFWREKITAAWQPNGCSTMEFLVLSKSISS